MPNKNPYRYKYEGIQLKPSDKRYKKMARQRKNRGWDDTVCWSLDTSLARLIAPRLKRFRDCHAGTPSAFCYNADGTEIDFKESRKKWNDILDKMIAAFEIIGNDEEYFNVGFPGYEELANKVNEGLDLFREWYFALWS